MTVQKEKKKNVPKKSTWMAGRESESAVPDMLEFSYKFGISLK